MKIIRSLFVLIFIMLTITFLAQAQPGDPGGDPDVVPISGLGILLAAGALFGIKKLRDLKK